MSHTGQGAKDKIKQRKKLAKSWLLNNYDPETTPQMLKNQELFYTELVRQTTCHWIKLILDEATYRIVHTVATVSITHLKKCWFFHLFLLHSKIFKFLNYDLIFIVFLYCVKIKICYCCHWWLCHTEMRTHYSFIVSESLHVGAILFLSLFYQWKS